ncbi:MAG: oligoendopeptidase F, partial [Desulfocucumaceae bacterium]
MAKNGGLPQREDIPGQFKWRLEDIYPDDKIWEGDFKRVQEMMGEAEAYRGKLGESAGKLLGALRLQDRLRETSEKVYTYARMRRDEDNARSQYQALTDRAEGLSARAGAALSFIVPEILSIPKETINSFVREEAGLSLYRFAL